MENDIPKINSAVFTDIVTKLDGTYKPDYIEQQAEAVISGKYHNFGHPHLFNIWQTEDGTVLANIRYEPGDIRVVELLSERKEFLRAASGGSRHMHDFLMKHIKSVESGECDNIVGSHYSIEAVKGHGDETPTYIMAKAFMRSKRTFQEYNWRVA